MKTMTGILNFIAAVCFVSCQAPLNLPDITEEYNNLRGKTVGQPEGMVLKWSEEFDGAELNRSKWSSQYYSTFDMRARTNLEDMKNGTLPEPGMEFTGKSIILYADDYMPERPYWQDGERKVSSIQTYDWRTNKNNLGDIVGGYVEAKIRRTASDDAQQVNCAFWLDSPGPDLKYYMEDGYDFYGEMGIRPHGQLFEIDFCENLNTQIVLHGNVLPNGNYDHNLCHYIVQDINFKNRWTKHALLWTPNALKFYIDDCLVVEYSDPKNIYAPNHFMNIIFGAYGTHGRTEIEVDYVRFYQWDTEDGNMLPNGAFEYSDDITPWEGEGIIDIENVTEGKRSLKIEPGKSVHQYIYLDSGVDYILNYTASGKEISVIVDNIIPVSGEVESQVSHLSSSDSAETFNIEFTSKEEKYINKATARIAIKNEGTIPAYLDGMTIKRK